MYSLSLDTNKNNTKLFASAGKPKDSVARSTIDYLLIFVYVGNMASLCVFISKCIRGCYIMFLSVHLPAHILTHVLHNASKKSTLTFTKCHPKIPTTRNVYIISFVATIYVTEKNMVLCGAFTGGKRFQITWHSYLRWNVASLLLYTLRVNNFEYVFFFYIFNYFKHSSTGKRNNIRTIKSVIRIVYDNWCWFDCNVLIKSTHSIHN